MNPSKLYIWVGDLAPSLLWQLLDASGAPFPLTGSNPTVRFSLVLASGGAAVLDSIPCAIVDPSSGTVRLDWPSAAAGLAPDLYSGQFVARQNSLETTFPVGPKPLPVLVRARPVPQTSRLDIYPPNLRVAVGHTAPASLEAYLTTNGGDPERVTDQVVWSSPISPPLLAVSGAGDVTGLVAGTATVTATLGTAQAQVSVVITP